MARLAMVVALLLLALPAQAFTFYPVNYTGAVTESGVPITGTRTVTLSVYDVPTGGSPLFTQTPQSISIVNGVFHTNLLGPSSLWTGADRYIGVTVSPGTELTPRVYVTWSPYAVYTPRTSPLLVTRFSNSANVGDQWTKIDSVTVSASVDGFAVISVDGFATQTINPASAMQYAIAETTPVEALSLVISIPSSGTTMPMNATITTATTLGTHKYYLWGKVLAAGGQYLATVRHFSALYIPS